ncbi:tyrosine-protein phosphatase [Cohnella hongkongensis]|uniref:Tyrosine-protein phosphatase n=1 Tax=Cohnella hongkongensis TaxID=178337 RepID=A0ABV9F4Y9_9BACL
MNKKLLRRVPFRNIANFRDLGGYPTEEGGVTRYGVFYRSGNLHRATQEEVEFLKELGVRTVFDLRYETEYKQMPDADLGDGAVSHSISLFSKLAPEQLAVNHGEKDTQSLVNMYIQVLSECSDKLRELFEAIAEMKEGAGLIHCAVGKDRTGIAVMFLLALAGVEEADIVADYEVSRTYIANFSDDLTGSHYSNMHQFLAYIRETYGSPTAYLESIGIEKQKLDFIRNRFVENA